MEQPQLEHVLSCMVGVKSYPSGSNHYSVPCLVGHKHAKGYDSRPSMTISFGFGKSWCECFGCGHKRPFIETLLEAAKVNPSLGELILLTTKYESETALTFNFTPAEPEIKDYTIPYNDLLERPLPAWATEFMATKGVSVETAKKFGVSWVPQGYSDDWLGEDLHGRERRARKRGIVLPVLEKKGDSLICRGTQLRYVDGESRYTTLHQFSSSYHFFGEQYMPAIQDDYVFLVEGPFDVMHLVQEKVLALGLFGTKLSSHKIQRLKKLRVSCAYLALDADKPGRVGTEKIHQALRKELIPSKVLNLTQDPKYYNKKKINEIIKYGTIF